MTAEQFYELQPIAVFGVSSKGRGFGASAFKELLKAGIHCYAVNPKGGVAAGNIVFPSLRELPEAAKSAVILTRETGALQAVEECSRHDVKYVWLQGGSDTAEVRRLCGELKMEVVRGGCIILRKGGFPHSIHRFLHDLFSRKVS